MSGPGSPSSPLFFPVSPGSGLGLSTAASPTDAHATNVEQAPDALAKSHIPTDPRASHDEDSASMLTPVSMGFQEWEGDVKEKDGGVKEGQNVGQVIGDDSGGESATKDGQAPTLKDENGVVVTKTSPVPCAW